MLVPRAAAGVATSGGVAFVAGGSMYADWAVPAPTLLIVPNVTAINITTSGSP